MLAKSMTQMFLSEAMAKTSWSFGCHLTARIASSGPGGGIQSKRRPLPKQETSGKIRH